MELSARRVLKTALAGAVLLGCGYAGLGLVGFLGLSGVISLLPEPAETRRAEAPPSRQPDSADASTPSPDPSQEGPEAGTLKPPAVAEGSGHPRAGLAACEPDRTVGTAAPGVEITRGLLALASSSAHRTLDEGADVPEAAGPGGRVRSRPGRSSEPPSAGPAESSSDAIELFRRLDEAAVSSDGTALPEEEIRGLEPEVVEFLRAERAAAPEGGRNYPRAAGAPPQLPAAEDPEEALRSAAEFEAQGVVSGHQLTAEVLEGLHGDALGRP